MTNFRMASVFLVNSVRLQGQRWMENLQRAFSKFLDENVASAEHILGNAAAVPFTSGGSRRQCDAVVQWGSLAQAPEECGVFPTPFPHLRADSTSRPGACRWRHLPRSETPHSAH